MEDQMNYEPSTKNHSIPMFVLTIVITAVITSGAAYFWHSSVVNENSNAFNLELGKANESITKTQNELLKANNALAKAIATMTVTSSSDFIKITPFKTYNLSNYKLKDKVVYYNDLAMPTEELDQLTVILYDSKSSSTPPYETGYAIVEPFVYYQNKVIQATTSQIVDLKTFEPMIKYEGYSKDNRAVYFQDKEIIGVDLASFEVMNTMTTGMRINYPLARDKQFVYWFGQKVEGANPATVSYIGSAYFKDDKAVYDALTQDIPKPMVGVDIATFQLVSDPNNNEDMQDFSYTKDKTSVFHNGAIVKDASPATFKIEFK